MRLTVALVAVLALALPSAASAACGAVEHFRPRRDAGPGRAPLAIGDSVMLGAAEELAAEGFEVDVHGCRQMAEGVRVLAARRRAGTLPDAAVIALGANWVIKGSEIRRAIHAMGRGRTLGLVTPREDGGGSGSDAHVVRAAARRHPGRVRLLDWVRYSAGHGGWFAGDGLHLGPGGARGFARLLRPALRWSAPLEAHWKRLGASPRHDSLAGRAVAGAVEPGP